MAAVVAMALGTEALAPEEDLGLCPEEVTALEGAPGEDLEEGEALGEGRALEGQCLALKGEVLDQVKAVALG